MATTAKLVGDVEVLLRGMRGHEGLIKAHTKQASDGTALAQLQDFAAEEHSAAAGVAAVAASLGGPSVRLRPTRVPSLTALASALAAQAQPFGEALLAEAAAVRFLADRAQVAAGLAAALHRADVVAAADRVGALYPAYAEWLVAAATELVIDEDHARLTPGAVQRLAGRAKDAAGVPFRIRAVLAQRGAGTVDHAVQTVRGAFGQAADTAEDVVRGATLPIHGYDDRSAADVVTAIGALDLRDDVVTVRDYERDHKQRKTVLAAATRRSRQLVNA